MGEIFIIMTVAFAALVINSWVNTQKKVNEIQKERGRARRYDCCGKCYTSQSMCPKAETCPETAGKEFRGTILAAGTIIVLPIVAIVIVTVFAALYL